MTQNEKIERAILAFISEATFDSSNFYVDTNIPDKSKDKFFTIHNYIDRSRRYFYLNTHLFRDIAKPGRPPISKLLYCEYDPTDMNKLDQSVTVDETYDSDIEMFDAIYNVVGDELYNKFLVILMFIFNIDITKYNKRGEGYANAR